MESNTFRKDRLERILKAHGMKDELTLESAISYIEIVINAEVEGAARGAAQAAAIVAETIYQRRQAALEE